MRWWNYNIVFLVYISKELVNNWEIKKKKRKENGYVYGRDVMLIGS